MSDHASQKYDEARRWEAELGSADPERVARFVSYVVGHLLTDEGQWIEEGETLRDLSPFMLSDAMRSIKRAHIDGDSLDEIVARQLRQVEHDQEEASLYRFIETSTIREGREAIKAFFKKYEYGVEVTYEPSPLFPEGRNVRLSIDEADGAGWFTNMDHVRIVTPHNNTWVSNQLTQYMENVPEPLEDQDNRKGTERLEGAELIDEARLASLRARYGMKAAMLMLFAEKVKELQLQGDGSSIHFTVPDFIPVEAVVYQQWLRGDAETMNEIEALRLRVLTCVQFGGLAVIRSSAVRSEDGQQHSGAGVYASVAVDPYDSQAFYHAVEDVYRSTNSAAALAYRRNAGIDDESMGLVIQPYIETTRRKGGYIYGHATSYGSHSELIDIITQHGVLQIDRRQAQDHLYEPMFLSRANTHQIVHTYPDHRSELGQPRSLQYACYISYALLSAERLFGGPMELEFVNNHIVQVRPCVGEVPIDTMVFPDDIPSCRVRAVGSGDVTLSPVPLSSIDPGYVVIDEECGSSRHNYGETILPHGGVIIIVNSSASGHIQAICRERPDIMCFYAYKGEPGHSEVIDLYYNEDLGNIPLRFVANGKEGRIYRGSNATTPGER